MASTSKVFYALFLILLPILAKGDNNGVPPILAPFFDNICNDVQCGRGSCAAAPGEPFGFVCNCENGWKRTRDQDEQNLRFLPCIVPNCTLDYSCMPAPPPTPSVPYNLSFFDPCYWIYCGEGTCTKNTTHTHTCQCNPGYTNLNNISAFPCYSQCAVGSDCARLGIRVSSSSSTPSSPSDNNEAASSLLGKFHWMAILLISGAMAMWN